MAAHKGHKKAGGRKKGTPNKTTREVKAALAMAFEGIGGVEKLVAWGKDNPGEFYRLWVRMLPQEVTGKDGAPLQLVKVVDLSGGDG